MTNLNDFEIVDGKLKKYKGNSTVVEIPDGVVSIDNYAFYMCASIEEVKLPNSIQEIGHNAFKSCKGLKKINIPRSVVAIGDNAFAFCRSLSLVVIPSSVKTMGEKVFYFCPVTTIKCEAIKCPSGWISNWKLAKSDGNALQNHRVVWGYKITANDEDDFEIENGVLKKYNGSAIDIKIPAGVTKIADQAFLKCEFIKSVIIPTGVVKIGDQAFRFCHALKSVKIPNTVTIIGDLAFSSCHELTSIEIPKGTLTIGMSAFSYCSVLASVTIPDSVTKIDSYAFRGCKSLINITIPSSVLKMGYRVFEECDSIVIKCEISKKPEGWDTGWKGVVRPVNWGNVALNENSGKKLNLEIVNGKIKKYTGTDTDIVIPEDLNITEIGDFAFMNCTSIKSVKIPRGVTVIGTRAFWGCSSLNNIQIPNSVTTIGAGVFYDCSSLEKITIPSSVTKMGYNVFLKCPNVVIYADTNAKPVGWDNQWNPDKRPVFWKVEPIAPQKNEQVKVRDDRSKEELDKFVETIKKAQEKETRKFVETVKKAQEPKVSPLSDFKIRNGVLVKYLGKDETLILPEEICAIDGHTFADNETVKKVILPKTLTTIGAGAFLDCYNLEEVFIPQSVEFIGRVAFRGCEKLTIHCEQTAHQRGWDTRTHSHWNIDNRPIVWGYKLK